MRNVFAYSVTLLSFALGALAAPGCGEKAVVLKKIGEICAAGEECGSEYCLDEVCTTACAAQGDCPQGFDCGLAKPAHPEATCYKATYNQAESATYGVNCSTVYSGCSQLASPCGAGLECFANSTRKCDASAYCTKTCDTDAACPPTFVCGLDPKDKAKSKRVCTPRAQCSDCITDDQCPQGYLCSTNKSGRFCGKRCATDDDCFRPRDGTYARRCVNDPNGKGKVCSPANGHCSGQSPIKEVTQKGGICAYCRPGRAEDCTSPNAFCYEDKDTTERFCSVECTLTFTNRGVVKADTCPTGTRCFIVPKQYLPGLFAGGQPCAGKTDCALKGGICTGDVDMLSTTCYP